MLLCLKNQYKLNYKKKNPFVKFLINAKNHVKEILDNSGIRLIIHNNTHDKYKTIQLTRVPHGSDQIGFIRIQIESDRIQIKKFRSGSEFESKFEIRIRSEIRESKSESDSIRSDRIADLIRSEFRFAILLNRSNLFYHDRIQS